MHIHRLALHSLSTTLNSAMADTVAETTRPRKIVAGADGFGAELKDALVEHLRSLNIEVEDLGTSDYYSVGAEVGRRISLASDPSIRGLVACGTGIGVGIFANKYPGVYATTCLTKAEAVNTRSINNCNVLAVSGMSTSKDSAVEILEAWLDTPFRAPCPASNNAPWEEKISCFFEQSLTEMPKIGKNESITTDACSICCLVKNRELKGIDMIPGGSMKIVRESPTSAIVRFIAGSVEPAHHHTFGHDLVVMEGKKTVWNLTKNEKFDLGVGDYLFTPAGDVHRVKYHEDTEFFIKWDGHWDIIFDEELETAKKEIENGSA